MKFKWDESTRKYNRKKGKIYSQCRRMDDVTTTRVMLDEKNPNGDSLNSPLKIIIKKEDIGLYGYQHKKYQYNLFNNRVKNDQYYEDLNMIKDRLGRTVPNMQQVIHMDMKRVITNKVYERRLRHDLNGPRGLNWQCSQRLKRLTSDERDVERDLMRLRNDLTRIALSSSLNGLLSSRQDKDLSPTQTPRLLFPADINSSIQTPQKTKLLLKRSLLISTSQMAINRFTSIDQQQSSINEIYSSNERPPWIHKQIISKANENRSYLQHAHTINQEKLIIEQKLKEFLH